MGTSVFLATDRMGKREGEKGVRVACTEQFETSLERRIVNLDTSCVQSARTEVTLQLTRWRLANHSADASRRVTAP